MNRFLALPCVAALIGLGGPGCSQCTDASDSEQSKARLSPEQTGGSRVRTLPSLAPLSAAEKKVLLKLARRSVTASVTSLYPSALTDDLRISPRLKKLQGAFVTLKKEGQLRGCIGSILPRDPLYQSVIKNARNAALHDRRFRPVTPAELQHIEVEVSALSLPTRVASWREIVIGTHGIILRQGQRSATFLPHVATEQRWDLMTTLRHLSHKAGLAPEAYRAPDTEFHVYTAEVWSEKEP